MKPTIRQLTYLCALADERGFGAAAHALNASQPALSSGLRELEKALDVILVDRSRRELAFTEAGKEAVRRARDILTRVHDFTEAVKEAAEPLTGSFRLGAIPTIAPFAAPALLSTTARRRPKLQLRLVEDVTARLVDHVRTGAVDAALIALPYDTPGLDVVVVGDDPLYCVVPKTDPLAAAVSIAPEDLRERTLLILEDGHCLRDHALAACEKVGTLRGGAHSAAGLQTVLGLVRAGEGVTIAPAIAVKAGAVDHEGLEAKPIAGGRAVRRLALVWRPGAPREAEMPAMAQTVAEALHGLVNPVA